MLFEKQKIIHCDISQKMTRKAAAEFSFFLAVPTMFAATAYKVYKLFTTGGMQILADNMGALIIGNIVAFVVALLAIKFFISFVTKYGFKAFWLLSYYSGRNYFSDVDVWL